MKSKLKKFISVFLIELIILMPIAIVDALTISEIKTEEITQVSAKVKWKTDVPSEGKVNFGATKALGQTSSSPNFVKDHSILLSNLAQDTSYYFEVSSDTITDNNNGNYYQLTTLPQGQLFVNASIPRYYNQGRNIDITGKSIRLAEINMYVNNNVPRTLYTRNDGTFDFPNTELKEGDNTIRFTAQSQSQKVEATYTITVDTTEPIITISEIPKIIGSERIRINGTVSEPVTISFYVRTGEEDTIHPPKITNLRNTSVQANKVDLSWDKLSINDFEEYIVYRNNTPLGIGSDSSYNDYTDVLANSDQTYVYQVAAMDKSGNIGEKSDPLIVKTLPGGRKNLPAEQVNIYESIAKAQKTITASKAFSEEIEIGKEDKFYQIRIEAVDIAGNKWLYEKEVLLDTKDPEIKIISPKGNAEIYESYADMVTIRGKTEPGARVYLYVLRTPFGVLDDKWDISGFPDKAHQLSEADLRANCRLNIQGEEQCKTHSDYETIADANGYFEFEDVDLTSMWAGAFKITEYPTGTPYYDFIRRRELKDFIESNLLFVAVDAAGRMGAEQIDYEIVTCWTTDLTWSAMPLIEYQSPTFLNIERLKEGTETIYFYFNFTYLGSGRDSEKTRIQHILVDKACGKGYLEEENRYNYSCSILRTCTEKLSPNGKTAYVACPLGRLQGVEKWTDDNWESFIDVVKNEMSFPFKITITYDEEYENNSIAYAKSHYLCTEVSYVVDATRINPKEVLPDWLLYDFVGFLNESISSLNEWIQKIGKILEWAAIGCMVSFFVKFITQIYRRITCNYDRYFKKISGTFQKIGGENNEQEDACRECIRQYDPQALKSFDSNKDVQDLISDTCLKECYPTCSSAWESEESLYKTYRWACDRVFGHKSPSGWTETVSTNALYEKATSGSSCSNDQSVRGKRLRAVNCNSVQEKYREDSLNRDQTCFEITNMLDRTESLYLLEEPSIHQNLYKISIVSKRGAEVSYEHVIKQNENYYLTNQDLGCEELCKGKGKVPLTKINEKEGVFTFETIGKGKDNKETVSALCTTTNQCLSFKKGNRYINKDGSQVEIKQDSIPVGYTKDCFYAAKQEPGVLYTSSNLRDVNIVSGDPDQRMECCCINSGEALSPFEYYQPTDIETKDGNERGTGTDNNPEALKNMEWSYRYYKINYKAASGATEYDPYRYIEGRDQMACFGQNHWLYDGFSGEGEGNLLTIDPMKQHIAAFQCLAISQIRNRLVLIKNIMVALENCLLSIRTTGKADTGVCKEIFTQYICTLIWKIITFIRDGCLPFGSGINLAESENSILEFIGVGMKGMWESVSDSQQELASEYGNAKLNNLLGVGEQEVFRKVCLGAFGYDWEIDADSLLDVAYHTPYKTLVQPILQSREYLTFDPINYQAKYEYRASWMLNPGCDLDNYEVYLTCVTRNDMQSNGDIDCSKQADPYGINCDCLGLPPDKAPPPRFYYQSRGKLKQNQLIQIDSTQITDRIKTSPYRYDHLMFKLRPDRNYVKNQGDITNCFGTGHEDGIYYFPITDFTAREVAGCGIDSATGQFTCKQGASFFYEEGNAWFTEIRLAGSTEPTTNILLPKGVTYYASDNPSISATVKYSKDDKKQCLVARLFDKDRTILDTTFRDLRQGETSGETIITMNRRIEEGDVTGGGYGFTIKYTDENGRVQDGYGKLNYRPIDRAKTEGGGSLIFNDKDNNGIQISSLSKDTYQYSTFGEKQISQSLVSGRLEIKLEDIGASIIVERVDPTKAGQNVYEFVVEYVGTPEQKATSEARFYLHLDLRNPITTNGRCDDAAGLQYDNEQIIISQGLRQKVEIPIYVLPGRSNVNKCDAKYEQFPLAGEDRQCVCGTTTNKDCPQENAKDEEGKEEDDYRYCYGTCRKYPKCDLANQNNLACVCAPDTPAPRYDCGAVRNEGISTFAEPSRNGWWCYEKPNVGRLTCNQDPPAFTPTAPQDTTPLEVTLNLPTDNLYHPKGQPITIFAIIKDDKVSGKEECEIIINRPQKGDMKLGCQLEGNSGVWTVRKEQRTDIFEVGELLIIYVVAKEPNMAPVISRTAQIKIEAPQR